MYNTKDDDDKLKKISLPVWKKLFKVIMRNKFNLIIMIICAVSLALLDTLQMVLSQYAIDELVTKNNFTYYGWYIGANIGMAVAFGLTVYGFIYQGGIIEANVSYDLRKEAFKTLQKLPFSYYDVTPQGWIMARMTSDARRLSQVISWGLIDFVWSILLMIATLIMLYFYNTILALIVTCSLPLMFLVTIFFRKRVLLRHREARHYNSELTAKFSESFNGAKTTKSLVIEDRSLMEFDETANRMYRSSVKANSLSSLYSSILLTVCYFIVAIIMYSGSYYASEGLILVGTLYLFIRATVNFFDPVVTLTNFISQLQQAQASAERVLDLIQTNPEIKDTEEVIQKYGDWFDQRRENWEEIQGEIEFKNVTFYYKPNEIILENFNLKINRGMSVALVGHTGSGKTTIVNLISRFYEPKEGQILIDGKDYKERSISWLHHHLGYVLQSPLLFSTTIMENIRYGRLSATDEEVIEASKAIGLHEIVMKFEKGYQTEVGEGGNLLSTGQKQLISFARAILANPKILILDEATSSIDSEAERLIQDATKKLLNNRTSFIVAHRLSTIVDCDLIIMLEMGKIIEMGNHETLLKQRGRYFELYKTQFLQEQELAYQSEMNAL